MFGQLAAMLFAEFHAGTRKSLPGFWPPLFEQSIKFVLICKTISRRKKQFLCSDNSLAELENWFLFKTCFLLFFFIRSCKVDTPFVRLIF